MIASIPSTIRNVFTNFNICETHAGKKLKALRKSPLLVWIIYKVCFLFMPIPIAIPSTVKAARARNRGFQLEGGIASAT